jgi:hypothetical protein
VADTWSAIAMRGSAMCTSALAVSYGEPGIEPGS